MEASAVDSLLAEAKSVRTRWGLRLLFVSLATLSFASTSYLLWPARAATPAKFVALATSPGVVRADALETAVKAAIADVLAKPDIVLREIERFQTAAENAPRVRDDSLQRLDDERRLVLDRYRRGEIDDGYLEEELARNRSERERIAKRPVLVRPNLSPQHDVEAVCEAARNWLQGAAGDDVTLIAGALALEVRASPEEAELLGQLPVFTHHWTNIGMTTWT